MKLNKLHVFYKGLLESLGAELDERDVIFRRLAERDVPIQIKGKTLVLPTDTVLRNADWDNTVGFHPLTENVMRGESEVLKKLRTMVQIRLSETFTNTALNLMELAVNVDGHSKLSPDQSTFLTLVPDADEKMLTNLSKIFCNSGYKGPNRLIKVYMKRGGKINGKEFNRVCTVRSDLIDQLVKDKPEVFGVKIRKKDLQAYIKLTEYILGTLDTGEFDRGTNSEIAPYLHSLLQTYSALAGQLNVASDRFANVFEEDTTIPLGWTDGLNKFASYYNLIPNLDGNAGTPEKGKSLDNPTETQPAVPAQPQPQQPPAQAYGQPQQPQQPMAPIQPNTPPPQTSGGARSWADIQNSSPAVQQQMAIQQHQMAMQQQAMGNQWRGQQGGWVPGQQPAQAYGQMPAQPPGHPQSTMQPQQWNNQWGNQHPQPPFDPPYTNTMYPGQTAMHVPGGRV